MKQALSGREWPQWSLRGILLLTTICALSMGAYVSQFHCERQTIEWLKANGAEFSTEAVGPAWLQQVMGPRVFEHVTVIRLGKPLSAKHPTRLTDVDFSRLQALPHLHRLTLIGIKLSAVQCDRFRHFPALRSLDVSQPSLAVKSIEELVDARPEMDVNGAPAENLYRESAIVYLHAELPVRLLITAYDAAAAWKRECAKYKSPAARIAALRQRIPNLEQALTPGFSVAPAESAMLKSAIAIAKLDLARIRGNRGEMDAALAVARRSSKTMLMTMRQALASDSLDVYDFDFAWQLAAEPLLTSAGSGRDAERADKIYSQMIDDYRAMLEFAERISATEDGGQECRRLFAAFGRAVAQGEQAEFRGNRAAAREAFTDAKHLAKQLRLALRSGVSEHEIDECTAVFAYERSLDVDQRGGDAHAEQTAPLASSEEFDAWLAKLRAASYQHCFDRFSPPLLSTLLVTSRLRKRGLPAFEGPIEELLASSEQ